MEPKVQLAADANSEIWIYRVPAVADVDLTLGTDLPLLDLSNREHFEQITNTLGQPCADAGLDYCVAVFR